MTNADTFGKRYEKKFIVPATTLRKHVINGDSEFSKLFEFDYVAEGQNFNLIENIHFDTIELNSYHESLDKNPERKKIRVRFYNPNGLPEETMFLEIKTKEDGATLKSRIELRNSWLVPFINTGELPDVEFFELNSKKKRKKIERTVEVLRRHILEEGYRPMLRSSYMRFAFKLKESNKVRVTLDQDLRLTRIFFSQMPKMPYEKIMNKDDIIIEVKINDPSYGEMINFFEERFGEPQGFSKYCYGIYNTRDRFLIENQEVANRAFDSYR